MKLNMNKNKIVVLGRNYTSLLGMIRAVGKLDCEVTVIRSVNEIPKKYSLKNIIKSFFYSNKQIEEYSKYVGNFLYTIESKPEYLINLLLNTFKNDKDVIIIPTDDFTASTIDLYQDRLKERFLFPNINNTQGEITKIMDKKIQKDIAINSNLNVAESYVVKVIKHNYEIPDKIKYPVFTKPLISFKGNKSFMKKCDNESELRDILNQIAEKIDCEILIEQFIEIEKEYAVLGYCNNNKVIMPGIIEMLESGTGAHKGVTLKGKVKKFSQNDNLYEKLSTFMSSLNFHGLFDIDLYESNGKIYFNELNLRFGASGFAITSSGCNLPKMLVDDLWHKTSLSDSVEINESIFINEKVNLEEYIAKKISYKKFKSLYENVKITFVYDKDDKLPYHIYKKMLFVAKIKNLFR